MRFGRRGRGSARPWVVAVVAAASLAVPALAPGAAGPSEAATPSGRAAVAAGVPRLPRGAVAGGALAPSRVLHLDVDLALADPGALSAFVRAVSTPGSPEYRHYLARGQYPAGLTPSPASVAAVRAWLRDAGLTVGRTTPDGLLVPVEGTATRVAQAFGTQLVSVRLASGRAAFTDTVAPSVPGALAGDVAGVIGLDDLTRWHTDLRRGRREAPVPAGPLSTAPAAARPAAAQPDAAQPDAAQPDAAGPQACGAGTPKPTFTGGPMTFTRLAGIYGYDDLFGEGRSGNGVTVALYELDPYLSSDIDTFEQCYGEDTPIRSVEVDGGSGTQPDTLTTFAEPDLDIEDVAALAPGANLVVYEGPNGTSTGPIDTFDRIETDDVARVVSTSWGQCEPDNTAGHGGTEVAEGQIFGEMAAHGQTVLAAAGDDGSEGCWGTFNASTASGLAVDDPASQVDVTGVGGTALPSGSTAPGAEKAWNDCYGNGPKCAEDTAETGAGGGGVSSVWAMPTWQRTAGRGTVSSYSTGSPCKAPVGAYCREVPDVSADADPSTGFPIYSDGNWLVVGGTSAAAPEWAALSADVDQGCGEPLGLLNPALYKLGGAGSDAFNDVTATGDNDYTQTNSGAYPTAAGYDMATGWGSPDAPNLLSALQPSGGCPVVASLSSSGGPLSGGTELTISGDDLQDASAVHFGSTLSAQILTDTATTVTVTVPSAKFASADYVTVSTPNGTSADSLGARYVFGVPHNGQGYWLVASDGGLFSYGDAHFFGSMGGKTLDAPIVGMAPTPDDGGYWEVASDGGLFAFGDARFYGSMGGKPLDAPIVGMAVTPDGGGYWEVALDGGLFAFGDARFYGSMGGKPLNAPIIGIAATPDGDGYWEVASDGGIFAFGDAQFYGSMGGKPLNEPIVGITPSPDGAGYWEVASDGGLFSFGDSHFYGSMGGKPLNAPIVGMAATPDGAGYWEVAADGGIFTFPDANFYGSAGSLGLVRPVVGMAET
jgi:hypothetical protein